MPVISGRRTTSDHASRQAAAAAAASRRSSSAVVPAAAFAHIVPAHARIEDGVGFVRSCVDALRDQAGGRGIVLAGDDSHMLDVALGQTADYADRSSGKALILLSLVDLRRGCQLVAGVSAFIRPGQRLCS